MPKLQKSVDDGHFYTVAKLGSGPIVTYQITKEGVNWLARYSIGIGQEFSHRYLTELITLRLAYTGHSGVSISNEYNDYPFTGGFEHPQFLSLPTGERIRRIEAAIQKEYPNPNPKFFFALARIFFVEHRPIDQQKGLLNLQKALKHPIWDNGQLLMAVQWLFRVPWNLSRPDFYVVILEQLDSSKFSDLKPSDKEGFGPLIQGIIQSGLEWLNYPQKAAAKRTLFIVSGLNDIRTKNNTLLTLLKAVPASERIKLLYPITKSSDDPSIILGLIEKALTTIQTETEFCQAIAFIEAIENPVSKNLEKRPKEIYWLVLEIALKRNYKSVSLKIFERLIRSKNTEALKEGVLRIQKLPGTDSFLFAMLDTLEATNQTELASTLVRALLVTTFNSAKRITLYNKLYGWGDRTRDLADKLFNLARENSDTEMVTRICQEQIAFNNDTLWLSGLLENTIKYYKKQSLTGDPYYASFLLEMARIKPQSHSNKTKVKVSHLEEVVKGLIEGKLQLPPEKYPLLGRLVKKNFGKFVPYLDCLMEHLEKVGMLEATGIFQP